MGVAGKEYDIFIQSDTKNTDMLWQEYDKVEFEPLYPFVYKCIRSVYYWVGVKSRYKSIIYMWHNLSKQRKNAGFRDSKNTNLTHSYNYWKT